MLLDLATFLSLAAACAPGVAPHTLLAVARVDSGLDPLAIGGNSPGVSLPRAGTAAEAVRHAEALIAAGRDIDLGLAQINVRNLPRLGLTIPDAFDPCRNLAASARILTEGYEQALPSHGAGQAALRTALSFYNTGDPDRGFRNGYVARVLAKAGQARATSFNSMADRPQRASFVADWDVFGRARSTPAHYVIPPPLGAQP